MYVGYLERAQVKTYSQQWTRRYRMMDYRGNSVLAFVLMKAMSGKIKAF